jgi:hypothetical protein
MNTLLKFFVTSSIMVSFAIMALLAVAASHGSLNIWINGHQAAVSAQKLIIASVGFLVAGIVLIAAISIAALATVASGLAVMAILALVGLLLVAIAIPFLLPIIIPVLIVAFIVMLRRNKLSQTAHIK